MMTGEVPARPRKARLQPLRAEKSAVRRAAILKAALDEFCEKGFAATRVEDVAARAGVAKGKIYLNFKDKQALFEELIRSTLGAHIARVEIHALLHELLTRLVDLRPTGPGTRHLDQVRQ